MCKKLIALLMTGIMCISMTACGSNQGDQKAEATENNASGETAGAAKDTLNVVVDSDVGNMGPFGSGTSFSYLAPQVYEAMFELGYEMEVTPRLAEKWDKIDDTHYTFYLRQGVEFSDGNKMTADDVIFSLNLYTQDANYGRYVEHVDFEKTKAIDDYTVDLYFKEENAFAFSQLAGVRIISEESWNASPDQMVTDPVGTGPYKLQEYVSGSYFTLEANEKYWGGAPDIKTVKFTVTSEPSQRTTALETGEADLVMNLQASDVEYMNNKEGFTVIQDITVQSMSMFFNMNDASVFSNKELRQALCYAVDNSAINVAAYGGFCEPSKTYFSTAMMDYTDDMESAIYSVDKDKAKELFGASGVNGGNIRIATDGTTQETSIAEILQSELTQYGFTVQIDNYDPATIWSVGADPTQWDILLMLGSAPSGYGLDKMTAFLTGLNFSGWKGEKFDEFTELCVEASSTADEAKRLDYTKQALEIVSEEVPAYSFIQNVQNYAYVDNLNFKVWNQASLYVKDLKFE